MFEKQIEKINKKLETKLDEKQIAALQKLKFELHRKEEMIKDSNTPVTPIPNLVAKIQAHRKQYTRCPLCGRFMKERCTNLSCLELRRRTC